MIIRHIPFCRMTTVFTPNRTLLLIFHYYVSMSNVPTRVYQYQFPFTFFFHVVIHSKTSLKREIRVLPLNAALSLAIISLSMSISMFSSTLAVGVVTHLFGIHRFLLFSNWNQILTLFLTPHIRFYLLDIFLVSSILSRCSRKCFQVSAVIVIYKCLNFIFIFV